MPQTSIDLAQHDMLALSRPALLALRATLAREIGPDGAAAMQEAGYAGGERIFALFRHWTFERGAPSPEEMSVEQFESFAAAYFREIGWGSVTIGTQEEKVVVLDAEDWAESDPEAELEGPGCHFTTGMLADLFGRVSSEPMAVLEVECRSAGAHRCRWLLGSPDVMTALFDSLEQGSSYADAVQAIG